MNNLDPQALKWSIILADGIAESQRATDYFTKTYIGLALWRSRNSDVSSAAFDVFDVIAKRLASINRKK